MFGYTYMFLFQVGADLNANKLIILPTEVFCEALGKKSQLKKQAYQAILPLVSFQLSSHWSVYSCPPICWTYCTIINCLR